MKTPHNQNKKSNKKHRRRTCIKVKRTNKNAKRNNKNMNKNT
jgi:hypothetical protein